MNAKRLIHKIAITCNLKREVTGDLPEDFYAEFDSIVVPNAIKEAVEKNGFSADILEANEELYIKLKEGRYDFVFNIAEGLYGESRESHVPAMLEMLQIPYCGSGVLTQALALDKRRTKEILLQHGIPTPEFQIFSSAKEIIKPSLKYPLIVKPNCEGSSKGINNKSLVHNEKELREMIKFVLATYKQKALVEEYLPGREFTVALIGNKDRIFKLPIIEIFVDKYPNSNGVYTYEHKFVTEDDSFSQISDIAPAFRKKVYEIAVSCFRAMECRDMCRVDIRCDTNNEPSVIEINPLPGVHPNPEHVSYFTKACRLGGLEYDNMINSILVMSAERTGYGASLSQLVKKSILQKLEEIDIECKRSCIDMYSPELITETQFQAAASFSAGSSIPSFMPTPIPNAGSSAYFANRRQRR